MHLYAAIRVCSLLSLLTAVLSVPVQLHDNDGGSSLQQRPRIRLGRAAASGHEFGKTELTSLERRVIQQPDRSHTPPYRRVDPLAAQQPQNPQAPQNHQQPQQPQHHVSPSRYSAHRPPPPPLQQHQATPFGSALSPEQAAIAADPSRMHATHPWINEPGLSAQEAAYACEVGSEKPNCVRKGVVKEQNGNK